MNLYKIIPIDPDWGGHDTFDSAIVCAEDPRHAVCMRPTWTDGDVRYEGKSVRAPDHDEWVGCLEDTWPEYHGDVAAIYLGVADESVPCGIVCASFNAG